MSECASWCERSGYSLYYNYYPIPACYVGSIDQSNKINVYLFYTKAARVCGSSIISSRVYDDVKAER